MRHIHVYIQKHAARTAYAMWIHNRDHEVRMGFEVAAFQGAYVLFQVAFGV
jgi:hypothetical protein